MADSVFTMELIAKCKDWCKVNFDTDRADDSLKEMLLNVCKEDLVKHENVFRRIATEALPEEDKEIRKAFHKPTVGLRESEKEIRKTNNRRINQKIRRVVKKFYTMVKKLDGPATQPSSSVKHRSEPAPFIILQSHYVYLLQEREFIKTNEPIYKVGMTTKEQFTRFKQYPKGSVLLFQMICADCVQIERDVLIQMKDLFTSETNIGREYFSGDYRKMVDVIYNVVKNECIDNVL
jgi:hypothetical protein